MTRLQILGLALVAAMAGGVLAWGRWAPFDWPALPHEPCPTLNLTPARIYELNFDRGGIQRREEINGVRVRQPWGERGLNCLVVVSRADCRLAGPATAQVLSGERLEHFEIPAGRSARLRAHRGRTACRLDRPQSKVETGTSGSVL